MRTRHTVDGKPKYTNALAKETSPYLLQHAHNPVDWRPWNDASLAEAKATDKPIFLSVGYSTCHWCHVMEEESFEDEEIAGAINAHFIPIKVDREERPDVDGIYMTAVQALTGHGGWPMSVFMTPSLKPFFAGTYFPPKDGARGASIGFLTILERLAQAWRDERAKVDGSADEITRELTPLYRAQAPLTDLPSLDVVEATVGFFSSRYDPVWGGLQPAPKFPSSLPIRVLLRHFARSGEHEMLDMALHSFRKMAAGGLRDHVGGGFHRYSVDEKWLIPHFEKMLYDNAQLVHLYLDAYLVSGQQRFADVARDILRYVLRDMTHPEGGFYSAEDADSEGKEGKFYTWTKAEIEQLLTPEEAAAAIKYFGVTDAGNFVDHSDPHPLPNQNILSIKDPEVANSSGKLLASAKEKLFAARSKRVRPHLDDKVLASWNGMMLGAIARAGVVLQEPSCQAAAEKNLRFVRAKLWDEKSRTLYHRWRDGERDEVQLLDAYANMLAGVLELYQATINPDHLEFARALADSMLENFHDPKEGGFWQSGTNSHDLILRVKDDYDGAEPSGNSVATLALLKLGAICDEPRYRKAAESTLQLFSERLRQIPQAVPLLLHALDFWMEEPRRVVIAGDPNDAAVRNLLAAAHGVYQTRKVVLGNVGPVEAFAKTLPPKDGPTVYLCTGTACMPPTNDPAEVKRLLARSN